MTPRFAVRVDGNRHIGLGHLFRCLRLAVGLRRLRDIDSEFLLLESSLLPPLRAFIEDKGFTWRLVSRAGDPWREDPVAMADVLGGGRYRGAIVDLLVPDDGDDDLRANPEFTLPNLAETLEAMKGHDLPRVIFSDSLDRMDLDADVVINASPLQDPKDYAASSRPLYLVGPNYHILADEFLPFLDQAKEFRRRRPKVLLFFGGSDHREFADRSYPILAAFGSRLDVSLFLGAATPDGPRCRAEWEGRGLKVYFGVTDLAPILFNADLVIGAGGTTLLDLAALGIPCAALATRDRQARTTAFLARKGVCWDLGAGAPDLAVRLEAALRELALNPAGLARMREAQRRFVGRAGLDRVVAVLSDILNGHSREAE